MIDHLFCVGVMTGTSCDGADGVILRISVKDGAEKIILCHSKKFPAELRRKLRITQRGELSVVDVAFIETEYSDWIASFCHEIVKRSGVDRRKTFLAIHGQTIWHEPPFFSIQLLEPARVAVRTGLTTLSRFRQPDLASNGEGAPLVPYYHWLRTQALQKQFKPPFAIHNIGGIANLTVITKRKEEIVAFDTGPGNALIDLAVEKFTKGKKHFDNNGKLADSQLQFIDWRALEKLAKHSYFTRKPPKSTGRELFNEEFVERIPGRGASKIANATAFTAHTVALAYRDFVVRAFPNLDRIYVAGGGAKNIFLVQLIGREIKRLIPRKITISTLPAAFGPPSYLEAMAFARLGFEGLLGNVVSLKNVTGAKRDGIGAAIIPGSNYKYLLKCVGLIHK